MLATGKLAVEAVSTTRQGQENVIGMEFSGIDSTGVRLMGMGESALSNLCIADEDLSWEVPKHFSLEEAASIPGKVLKKLATLLKQFLLV